MRLKFSLFSFLVLISVSASAFSFLPGQKKEDFPERIVQRTSENFSKIKDVRADITFDSSLQIFGCGGTCRREGTLIFKAPDRLKVFLDGETYIIKGNYIRKIDKKGKLYIVRLIHAPDFSIGFTPNLLPHNFNLSVNKIITGEVVLEGLPKPGILKNVNKVFFTLDTKNHLLKNMKMEFPNKRLSGFAEINYQNINNIFVPIQTKGKSALEIRDGFLAGFYFDLKGKNVILNSGVLDSEFN